MRGKQTSGNPLPLSRERLFHHIGPLVGAAFLALIALAQSGSSGHDGELLIKAAMLTSLTVAAMVLVPWDRLPALTRVGPALVFVFVAVLIRQSTGGHESIYAQLILVPILWLAAYGTGFQVAAGVAGTTAMLMSPLLLAPGAGDRLPQTGLLVLMVGAVGFGVEQLLQLQRSHADRLVLLARTDALTGVGNRLAWDEDLAATLETARIAEGPLCLALIDVDHFKEYNDERGHQAGDRLLKEFTAWWRGQLRDGDIIARLGGDEFAVILPGCPPDPAHRIMQRLCADLPDGQTCSTGLVSWDGEEAADELMARADTALYEAKEKGRDRIVVA